MIKGSVVSGSFYPREKDTLQNMLSLYFQNAEKYPYKKNSNQLYGIIVPHAGYIYSGQTAAITYNMTKKYKYKKAIIVAPSHYPNSLDFFVGNYEYYETPLGLLEVDQLLTSYLLSKYDFSYDDRVDTREHSLEVQLPFLKYLFPDIYIIPIIFCKQSFANAEKLAKYLLEIYDKDTLIVISTDLSHFHNVNDAEKLDNTLLECVKDNNIELFKSYLVDQKVEACGFGGILTLMHMAKSFENIEIDNFAYSHSGIVTKDNNQVVGYMGCGFYKSLEFRV